MNLLLSFLQDAYSLLRYLSFFDINLNLTQSSLLSLIVNMLEKKVQGQRVKGSFLTLD